MRKLLSDAKSVLVIALGLFVCVNGYPRDFANAFFAGSSGFARGA